MGNPGDGEEGKFFKVETEGAIIWLSHEIVPEQAGGRIDIYLNRFLFFKNLAIRGARLR